MGVLRGYREFHVRGGVLVTLETGEKGFLRGAWWWLWVEGGGVGGGGGLWGRGQIVRELVAVHNGCLVMNRGQTVLGLGACPGFGRQGGRWAGMGLLSM